MKIVYIVHLLEKRNVYIDTHFAQIMVKNDDMWTIYIYTLPLIQYIAI